MQHSRWLLVMNLKWLAKALFHSLDYIVTRMTIANASTQASEKEEEKPNGKFS